MLMNNKFLKKSIRQSIKELRQNSSSKHNENSSAQISNHIKNINIYSQAQHVGFYFALKGEVDPHNLFNSLSFTNKTAYYPKINIDNTLTFLRICEKTTFIQNKSGIFEPQMQHEISIQPFMLDLLLVPVVAFDLNGTRLGLGGGCYDRTLTENRPKCLIGIAYEYQLYDLLPVDPWDIKLDMVVTEKNVYCMCDN